MNEIKNLKQINPYEYFGISKDATEKEIQQSFHKKMQNTDNPEKTIELYSMIRDKKGRDYLRWDTYDSLYIEPIKTKQPTADQINLLIKELAFLSAWELGEDA